MTLFRTRTDLSPRKQWVFTTGLSLAVSLDVLITIALSHYLRESKSGFARCVSFRMACRAEELILVVGAQHEPDCGHSDPLHRRDRSRHLVRTSFVPLLLVSLIDGVPSVATIISLICVRPLPFASPIPALHYPYSKRHSG